MCYDVQNEVITNMLDEIIEEYQDETAMNKATMKKALAQYNKELIYQVVQQDIDHIVQHQLSHAHASEQVSSQMVESEVIKAVHEVCEQQLADQKMSEEAVLLVNNSLLDKVLKEALLDVVQTTYMNQKSLRIQQNIAINEIGDQIIETMLTKEVQSMAASKCNQHNASLDIVSSMLEDQVLL